MRGLRQHPRARILVFLAGIGLILAFWRPLRQWPAQLIVRRDHLTQAADAIILMMGDIQDRTPHCAGLIQKGLAPKIVFVEAERNEVHELGLRLPEGEASLRYLQKLGIPSEAIIFDANEAVTSSVEELKADFKLIHERLPEARRLILCTSWYHSSRAHWMAQRLNPYQFDIKSVPSPAPESWYAKEQDFLSVFNEYLKWAYYLAHY